MLVGLVDYFQIYIKGSSDGSRENGNDRYLTLFELGKCQDIIFDEYDKKKHDKYSLIIFKNAITSINGNKTISFMKWFLVWKSISPPSVEYIVARLINPNKQIQNNNT